MITDTGQSGSVCRKGDVWRLTAVALRSLIGLGSGQTYKCGPACQHATTDVSSGTNPTGVIGGPAADALVVKRH